MKNYVVFFLFFLSFTASAQYDTTRSVPEKEMSKFNFYEFSKRIYVGGDVSGGLFGGFANISIAPLVGVDITNYWSAGIHGMYQYQRFNTVSWNTYGMGGFTRLRFIDYILIQAEADVFNTIDFVNNSLDRVRVPAVMLGAGISSPISRKSYFQFLLLYDFVNNPNNPLPSLVIPNLHFKGGISWYFNE